MGSGRQLARLVTDVARSHGRGHLVRQSLLLLVALGLAIATGWYIAERGLSYREMIIFFMATAGFVGLVSGERGLQVSFALWIPTLGLGYRTVRVFRSLHVHPSEVFLIGLLILLLASRTLLNARRISYWLPTWLLLFMPFWFWGWIPGLLSGRRWDIMFSEFRNFVLLIPLAWVANNIIEEDRHWRYVLLSIFLTATLVAALGVTEYFFPGVASLLPQFITEPEGSLSVEGFRRASFSFYGHPNASFLCVIALPLVLILIRIWQAGWQRVCLLLAVCLQVVAVFVGGFRSMWLMLVLQGFLFTVRRLGVVIALILLLLAIPLAYPHLPAPVAQRVESLIWTLEGVPQDSSSVKRWERATTTVETTLREPWGQGWAGTGWVHSDFLQVAANLGLLAGGLFLGAYSLTLRRLWHAAKVMTTEEGRDVAFALLLSYLSAGWMLATQPRIVLAHTILPIWLVWLLVEIWLRKEPSSIAPPR